MAKALTVQSVEKLKPDSSRRLEIPDGLLPGLYLVIQPSGVRSWAVRYRAAGKPRKLTLGPYPAVGLGTARERAREALQAVASGRDPSQQKQAARCEADPISPDRDLVSILIASFLERYVRPRLKPRSAEEVERLFKLHVLPIWGERRVQDITRRDVVELLDRITDRGTPVAANRTFAAIRKLFNWAVERSIIHGQSPCAGVRLPSAERSRDRVLSDEELRLVWLAASRIGWPFGSMVQLLILTGQRRDEVAAMRWSEISDAGRLWTIPGARTKNGQPHQVPLSNAARDILSTLPRLAGSDLVFTTTGATPVSGYSKAKERLDRLIAELAIGQASSQDAKTLVVRS
ncbi:tyrosine-type recombinase/integrase [Microvirga aerophila]|uniref:Integrase n=1 Tax=Microvirga aerophila TaxID=670291 RepID=A0A512BSW6_9HYPH|nr:integrase arm-type DNA-binding domain-containing protein [Microvirga aerophila]GEO15068.1 integrase [Microvirga aerophila]